MLKHPHLKDCFKISFALFAALFLYILYIQSISNAQIEEYHPSSSSLYTNELNISQKLDFLDGDSADSLRSHFLKVQDSVTVLEEHLSKLRKELKKEYSVHPYLQESTASKDSDTHANNLGCEDLQNLKIGKAIGSGVTKQVFKAELNGTIVAVKRVNEDGKKTKLTSTSAAAFRILSESVWLQTFADHSPHFLSVVGVCLPAAETVRHGAPKYRFQLVTEYCSGGVLSNYFGVGERDWEKGWKLSGDVVSILSFLSNSPLGPFMLRDFVATQFLVRREEQEDGSVERTVVLSDVDSLLMLPNISFAMNKDVPCSIDKDCWFDATPTAEMKCSPVTHRCRGYSLKSNWLLGFKLIRRILFTTFPPKLDQKDKHYLVKKGVVSLIKATEDFEIHSMEEVQERWSKIQRMDPSK